MKIASAASSARASDADFEDDVAATVRGCGRIGVLEPTGGAVVLLGTQPATEKVLIPTGRVFFERGVSDGGEHPLYSTREEYREEIRKVKVLTIELVDAHGADPNDLRACLLKTARAMDWKTRLRGGRARMSVSWRALPR